MALGGGQINNDTIMRRLQMRRAFAQMRLTFAQNVALSPQSGGLLRHAIELRFVIGRLLALLHLQGGNMIAQSGAIGVKRRGPIPQCLSIRVRLFESTGCGRSNQLVGPAVDQPGRVHLAAYFVEGRQCRGHLPIEGQVNSVPVRQATPGLVEADHGEPLSQPLHEIAEAKQLQLLTQIGDPA